jgi:cytochrome b6-f complex iron-sulfur subunit
MTQHKNILNRRAFLKSIWKYLGLLAVVEAIVVSFSLMRTRSSQSNLEPQNLKAVGSLSDIPPGTLIPFRTGRFFLIRLDDGGLMAISMICSHLGCTVNWDASDSVFKCPCHSSSFDKFGNVIKSPASKALNYHKVLVKEGMVMVDLKNILVKQKFDPGVVTYA